MIHHLEALADKWHHLLFGQLWERGTIESHLKGFCNMARRFGHALDALLLERGMNLLWYQRQCGIYLLERRDMQMLEDYLETMELATMYVAKALPKEGNQPHTETRSNGRFSPERSDVPQKGESPSEWAKTALAGGLPQLPDTLNTEEARVVLAKAVEAGLAKVEAGKYAWLKSKALLAYLCGRLYCGDTLQRDAVTKMPIVRKGHGGFFPEADLRKVFVGADGEAYSKLCNARQQLYLHLPPGGHELVDRLFR